MTGKVGHIDLVFGVQLGFISRSVQAGLQVSVCSGAILVNLQTHTYRHTDRQHLDQLI